MTFESADYQTLSEDNSNIKTTDMVGQDYLVQARQLSDSRSSTANNLPDLQIYDLSKDGGRTTEPGANISPFPRVIECPGTPKPEPRSSDTGATQSPFPRVIECPGPQGPDVRSTEAGANDGGSKDNRAPRGTDGTLSTPPNNPPVESPKKQGNPAGPREIDHPGVVNRPQSTFPPLPGCGPWYPKPGSSQ